MGRAEIVVAPTDLSFRNFVGFLTLQDHEFQFFLSVPEGTSLPTSDNDSSKRKRKRNTLSGAVLSCDEDLLRLISSWKRVLDQRLEQCHSLDEFLVEMKDIAERADLAERKGEGNGEGGNNHNGQSMKGRSSSGRSAPLSLPSPDLYQQILAELEGIGWQNVLSIDLLKQTASFEFSTPSRSSIPLELRFPTDYPKAAPSCHTDLPQPLDINKLWTGTHDGTETKSLKTLLPAILQYIEKFEAFWEMLNDFDENSWVLEPDPTPGSLSCCSRRVALGTYSSVHLEFEPLSPYNIPSFRFLGIDSVIGPLRQKLNENLGKWEYSQLPRANIEKVLEMTLPTKEAVSKEGLSVECGICYSYRLEGHVPEMVCENTKCGQPFHQKCLSGWLLAIPDTHTTFNTVFGSCPYCSSPIHVAQVT